VKARGDQCESCGKPLDPTDLIEPRSAVSGSTELEVRESQHVFLLQSVLSDRIREWVAASSFHPRKLAPPSMTKTIGPIVKASSRPRSASGVLIAPSAGLKPMTDRTA
jgi:methionyl-tRNA synthetase